MAKFTALIPGARGICGRALVEHLDADPEWEVIGLSRGPKDFQTKAKWISADLLDRADCEKKLRGLGNVTHIFFNAVTRPATMQAKAEEFLRILVNLMDVVEPEAKGLRHVQLMQGTNWYGSHLGPFKTPAKESDPRLLTTVFYYDQQDWLEARQKGKAWTWSSLRPHGIYGHSTANAISHLNGIAVYCAISKELGLPLRFPGKPGTFTSIYQWTESRHLAKGMQWAATTPACANQTFNFTNGGVDRWCNLWPAMARFFGMETGPVQTVNLVEAMADKEPLWARMVQKYGLQKTKLSEITDWNFTTRILSADFDQISCMTKARQAGWNKDVDTEEMLLRLFGELRKSKLIP